MNPQKPSKGKLLLITIACCLAVFVGMMGWMQIGKMTNDGYSEPRLSLERSVIRPLDQFAKFTLKVHFDAVNGVIRNWDRWAENLSEGFRFRKDWFLYQFKKDPITEIRYVEVEKEVPVPYTVKEYVYEEENYEGYADYDDLAYYEEELAYVWVNNLRMRGAPYLSAESYHMIPEGEFVTIIEGPTSHTTEIELRGNDYDAPWYKVETENGESGWVFGGGIITDHFPVEYSDWKNDRLSLHRLAWHEEKWDFGTTEEGETVRHTYRFTNYNSYPVTIKNVKPSCGCTSPDWTKDSISEGESGYITVEFDSKGKFGVQHKSLSVTFERSDEVKLLSFTGMVVNPGTASQ